MRSKNKIELRSLSDIEKSKMINLMNNSLVRRQMPLLKDGFNDDDYLEFLNSKDRMWKEHGFGPWAFVINGRFAGWGGLQPDSEHADLALVLHPEFWGVGKILYEKIIEKAFGELDLNSLQVLFPTTRTRIKGLLRLGFVMDKEIEIGDEKFIRYVLNR